MTNYIIVHIVKAYSNTESFPLSYTIALYVCVLCVCVSGSHKTNFLPMPFRRSVNSPLSECVSSGDGDEEEDEGREERLPSCSDYVMHFLTVFWKVLFACVPPTEYWNGWACFLVSISVIGLLTAIIGDLASHFGCTVGLRDTVTAVVFVALGTSLPGQVLTFLIHHIFFYA